MEQTYKRLNLLLIMMASVYAGFAHTLFSVERIGNNDFDKSTNSTEKYVYNLFGDSVVENNTTFYPYNS